MSDVNEQLQDRSMQLAKSRKELTDVQRDLDDAAAEAEDLRAVRAKSTKAEESSRSALDRLQRERDQDRETIDEL